MGRKVNWNYEGEVIPIGEDWMEKETEKTKLNKSPASAQWNKDFVSGRLVSKCRRKRSMNLMLRAIGNH